MVKILISNVSKEDAGKIYSIIKKLAEYCKIPAFIEIFMDAKQIKQNAGRRLHEYDIVFLNLDNEHNLALGKEIRQQSMSAAIVISSAELKKIQASAILRPSMFYTSIDDAKEFAKLFYPVLKQAEEGNRCFIVDNKDEVIKIPLEYICFFENIGRKVSIHTLPNKKSYEFITKFDSLTHILPESMFIKCHQSYIANMSKIRAVDKQNKQLVMISGETIDISRRNYTSTIEAFSSFLSQKNYRSI